MSKLTTHQRKARDLIQREDWDGALSELQRVLSVDTNNPALHNQIGDVYLRKDDIDQACDHFELAVDLYSTLGLQNNAVALCRKVVRLAPTRVEVRYNLSRLRMDQGLRNDAAAAFVDYLEHVHPDDDAAADRFEKRCVDAVEEFPDIAPAGQILEKLEAIERPVGAYKIVQRLAQRAADAGDTAAATRLTEKMRSLRVLLENNPDVDLDEPVDESAPINHVDPSTVDLDAAAPEIDLTEVAAVNAEADTDTAPAAAAPEIDLTEAFDAEADGLPDLQDDTLLAPEDAASAAIPNVDVSEMPLPAPVQETEEATEADSTAAAENVQATSVSDQQDLEDAEDTVTEIDLDGVGSLDATVAELQEVLNQDVQGVVDNEVAVSEPSPDVDPVAVKAESASQVPEYELPETSLEEVANLLEQEGVEPTPTADVSRLDPSAVDLPTADLAVPELLQPESPVESQAVDASTEQETAPDEADESQQAKDAASIADTFADPQDAVEADAPVSEIPELDAEDRPASVVYEPSTEPRLYPSSSDEQLRREPVWIPSPDTNSADPTPEEDGQTQELEEVIDTFREQMSRALGDDGAARYDLGVAYYEMGLYNEALAEFEVSVKCPGLVDRTLEMMASCLAQEGRHSEIVSLLEEPLASASDPSPDRLALQYAMGLALEAVGQEDDARRHFEEVALVDIGFKDIQSRLQR